MDTKMDKYDARCPRLRSQAHDDEVIIVLVTASWSHRNNMARKVENSRSKVTWKTMHVAEHAASARL
jgi:hypothetical protein